jgi:hypothetical protein
MTYKEVYQAISGVTLTTTSTDTIPVAYYQFPEDDPNNPAPPPPFMVYYYPGDDDVLADNINYAKVRQMTLELYCDNKDFTLEKAVEDMLTSNGFVFSKSEEYINSEKLYETIFETEVVITNG